MVDDPKRQLDDMTAADLVREISHLANYDPAEHFTPTGRRGWWRITSGRFWTLPRGVTTCIRVLRSASGDQDRDVEVQFHSRTAAQALLNRILRAAAPDHAIATRRTRGPAKGRAPH